MINKKHVIRVLCLTLLIVAPNAYSIPEPDGDGNSGAWIPQFIVSSSYAKVGKPVHVKWQSAFSVGCSLWTNQTGSRVVSTSGTTTVTPNSPTTMSVRISCTGTNGQAATQTRSFSVNRADHPELLSLNPTTTEIVIAPFQLQRVVEVSWSSSFSDYCELTGTYTDILPASGTRRFNFIPGLNKLEMVCKRYDGRTSNKLIKILDLPTIVYFTADPGHPRDSKYTLRWRADAESCRLDGAPVRRQGWKLFPKSSQSIHGLICLKKGNSVAATAIFQPDPISSTDPRSLPDNLEAIE